MVTSIQPAEASCEEYNESLSALCVVLWMILILGARERDTTFLQRSVCYHNALFKSS